MKRYGAQLILGAFSYGAIMDIFAKDRDIGIIWIDGRKYKGEKLKKYLLELVMPTILGK